MGRFVGKAVGDFVGRPDVGRRVGLSVKTGLFVGCLLGLLVLIGKAVGFLDGRDVFG